MCVYIYICEKIYIYIYIYIYIFFHIYIYIYIYNNRLWKGPGASPEPRPLGGGGSSRQKVVLVCARAFEGAKEATFADYWGRAWRLLKASPGRFEPRRPRTKHILWYIVHMHSEVHDQVRMGFAETSVHTYMRAATRMWRLTQEAAPTGAQDQAPRLPPHYDKYDYYDYYDLYDYY